MRYCGSPNSLNYGQATWREERSSHFSKNLTLHLFGEEERKWPGPKHYHYLSHVDVVFCVFNGSLMCQHFRWKAHFKVACKSRQLICPFFTVACVAPFLGWEGRGHISFFNCYWLASYAWLDWWDFFSLVFPAEDTLVCCLLRWGFFYCSPGPLELTFHLLQSVDESESSAPKWDSHGNLWPTVGLTW